MTGTVTKIDKVLPDIQEEAKEPNISNSSVYSIQVQSGGTFQVEPIEEEKFHADSDIFPCKCPSHSHDSEEIVATGVRLRFEPTEQFSKTETKQNKSETVDPSRVETDTTLTEIPTNTEFTIKKRDDEMRSRELETENKILRLQL